MSNNNLKHSKKHLVAFQKHDPAITADSLRKIGASIVRPENLTSSPDAANKVFAQEVNIGANLIKIKVVLNQINKLHSIHIDNK